MLYGTSRPFKLFNFSQIFHLSETHLNVIRGREAEKNTINHMISTQALVP